MSTRNIKLGLTALALLSLSACGDDKESSPPDNGPGTDFTRDAEVTDPDAGSDAGGSQDAGGQQGDPCLATAQEASAEGWAEGCYKCKPTTNEQLLNSCAKGFRTFDTSNYPASWKPEGPLPQL